MVEIPSHTKEALDRYVNDRLPPGGFLTAVLSNNLVGAVARADVFNKHKLPEIIMYLYWEIPANCWGSPEAVNEWLTGKNYHGGRE